MSLRSIALVPLVVCAHSPLWAQSTVRVSLSTTGTQADFTCSGPSISADGRFVAFWSAATTLLPGDTNGWSDVFVRDRVMQTTELVSVSTTGSQGSDSSGGPAISGDGRWVAFQSYAANLVAPDMNPHQDVFVHDRSSGTTELVSISSSGVQANGSSVKASISFDGRYVAFSSIANNLVPGDSNGTWDVFVRDRLLHTTTLVSVTAAGVQGDFASDWPSISADGRYVAFQSNATGFGGTQSYGARVYVADLHTGQLEHVSVDPQGGYSDGPSGQPSISADGRRVAFVSYATNLVTGDTNGSIDAFVRDRLLGQTTRVSVTSNGAESHSEILPYARVSANGRFVVFPSDAPDLVANDNNGVADVFVHDLLTGSTTRASVDSSGQEASGQSGNPALSADGNSIAFDSVAADVVPGDTNGFGDVFVRDQGLAASVVPYCFGDSSGTACPCGNSSPVGADAGCLNSFGLGGKLVGSGVPSIAYDDLVLTGSGMPDGTSLYFQGTTEVNGGAGAVFGDGLRCAGGTIVRMAMKVNSGGGSEYPIGTDVPISVRGFDSAGDVRTYQCWYRNAAAFCTPSTFNLTNGVQLTWQP